MENCPIVSYILYRDVNGKENFGDKLKMNSTTKQDNHQLTKKYNSQQNLGPLRILLREPCFAGNF